MYATRKKLPHSPKTPCRRSLPTVMETGELTCPIAQLPQGLYSHLKHDDSIKSGIQEIINGENSDWNSNHHEILHLTIKEC